MADSPLTFEDFFSPQTSTAFFQSTWGVTPTVLRPTSQAALKSLLSLSTVEDLLATRLLAFDRDLVLVNRSTRRPKPNVADNTPVAQAAMEGFRNGDTIFLMNLHTMLKSAGDLQRLLLSRLSAIVWMNAYIAPPGSSALKRHFDTHDAFIIQTSGRKTWRVYAPAQSLAVPRQAMSPKVSLKSGQLVLEHSLQAGEILYVPACFFHEAVAEERGSIHITVGVHSYTMADLVNSALAPICSNDRRYAELLPPTWDGFDPATAKRLTQLIDHFSEQFSFKNAQANLKETCASQQTDADLFGKNDVDSSES